MAWCIWYADASTFSSDDGAPADSPLEGVQVIAEIRDGQSLLWIYGEHYGWMGNQWCIDPELEPELGAAEVVLTGLLIDTEDFKRIKAEAMSWLDQHS